MSSTNEAPSHWWDYEAQGEAKLTGKPIEECYDRTIFRWLWAGSPLPLIDWLLKGRTLGPISSKALAFMLGAEIKGKDGKPPPQVPFRLVVKKGRPGQRGKPKDPALVLRDPIIANAVVLRIQRLGPGSYDAAIKEVVEEVRELGDTINEQTVRDAYDKRHGKARYGKK